MTSTCSYCGARAFSKDHPRPTSFDMAYKQRKNKGGGIPSCIDCNQILGSRIFPTMDERKAFVLARLEQRYKSLGRANWTPDELEELEPSLRATVQAAMSAAEILQARITFAKNRRYG